MKKSFGQLKSSIEKISKESLHVVGKANKIVTDGVQRLADHELKALNETYKNVLKSLKSAKSGESVKDLASKQLDMMQETVTRLINSAKQSLSIVADTRQELAGLVQKGLKSGSVAETEMNKITAKAKKAVADVKTAATNAQKSATGMTAQAMKSAEKVAATVKSDAQKVAATVKNDVKTVKHKLGSVLDIKPKSKPVKMPVVDAKPSANSRAARASSKSKNAATRVKSPAKKMG